MTILNELCGVKCKSFKNYTTWEDSNWFIFWHGLSGDKCDNQVLSIAYKNPELLRSWSFQDIDQMYKEEKLSDFLSTEYVDVREEDKPICIENMKTFLNDCSEYYLNKPYRF